MGVRGLTSYIARHAEQYLKPYELHDTHLVIDGDNLACNIYKDVTGTYSAFGGDYDDFYRSVIEFFHVLAECNVYAYVLMDGGYEQRKLRTVATRLRGKIAVIKRINPCGSFTIFPQLMKEVFVDALRYCGVPVMRCVFEADDELAALGRKLNCPVLSYDSDFYIHNVRYIPIITLTPKALTKRTKQQGKVSQNLRRNRVRTLQRRTATYRVLRAIQVDNVMRSAPKNCDTYKYLDCCIYRVENLITRGQLSAEKLPLFAALLGNDYIARSSFRNFFQAGMGKAGRSKKNQQQQRRIRLILQWLKNETSESAMEKILSRLKKSQRESLEAQVHAATSGYLNEVCRSYDFFVANYPHAFEEFRSPTEDEQNEIENECVEEVGECDKNEIDDEDATTDGDDEAEENATTAQEEESSGEESDSDTESEESNSISEHDGELEATANDDIADKIEKMPAWFLDKLYPAHLPRYFVDLMHLRKYINSPQIEHFPYNDCHEIALPILIYTFTLLNTVNGVAQPKQMADDGTEQKLTFTYMTRTTRVTNVCYQRHEMEDPPKYIFNPNSPNPLLLRHVFEQKMHDLNVDVLFDQLNFLPKDLQLYMLSIVYWLQKSQHCDFLHLHALLICVVVLRTIDSNIPAERDMRVFQKRFGKLIKNERLAREKLALSGEKRTVKKELLSLSVPDRMAFVPKSDCYLVQAELLKHFHMQEIFKKKYDLYSSTVIHAFAELQCIVFQLHGLNALLDSPYERPQIGQLYCGVFLYNIYDLLRSRIDVNYYVKNFIFRDSQMMFDFYNFLWNWCVQFLPYWKRDSTQDANTIIKKKRNRGSRRKKSAATSEIDPNADMLEHSSNDANAADEDEFYDLNNKFCTFLKIK